MREGTVRLQAVLAGRAELLVRVGWVGDSSLCPILNIGDLG